MIRNRNKVTKDTENVLEDRCQESLSRSQEETRIYREKDGRFRVTQIS